MENACFEWIQPSGMSNKEWAPPSTSGIVRGDQAGSRMCVSVCGGGLVGNSTAPEAITAITVMLNPALDTHHPGSLKLTTGLLCCVLFCEINAVIYHSESVSTSLISPMINARVT